MSRAGEILNSLTLEQKIGQMVCVRALRMKEKIHKMVSDGIIGSIGAVTIERGDIERSVEVMNEYLNEAKVPMLFYTDAEPCGFSCMYKFSTHLPTQMALGATFSPELAYKYGNIIGKEARAMGYGIVSNPVFDVNTNPDNPIINTRAFGDNVDHVIRMGTAYIKGMQDAGVIPNGKHYPGHGDTSVDSHVSMPIVNHDREYLMNVELRPYREIIKNGLWGIMTAHILFPSLLGEGEDRVPATLSRSIIYNILRKEFGFKGIIISDSLTMKGIKDNYGIEKAAIMAVKAGHDMILQDYNSDPEITINALAEAVRSGELDINEINESVGRILGFKERLGLLDNKPVDINEVRKIAGCKEHLAVAREVAEKAVTVLDAKSMPFNASDSKKVLLIATKSKDEGTTTEDLNVQITGMAGYLHNKCKTYCSNTDVFIIDENPAAADIDRLKAVASGYDYIIYSTFVRVMSYKEGSGTISQAQVDFINAVGSLGKNAVFMVFGSPYILRKFKNLENCICTYSDDTNSIDVSLEVLFGKTRPQGKLPITINEKYVYGYGL